MIVENVIAGAAGGFAKSLAEQNGRVALPKTEKNADGNTYVHFGFVLNIVLGGVAGVFMPDFMSAFTAGMSAAFVGEKAVERAPV